MARLGVGLGPRAHLGRPLGTGQQVGQGRDQRRLVRGHQGRVGLHQAALNAALADLLANPDRAAQMGARAKAHAQSRHDAAKAALDALAPLLPKAPGR